MNGAPEPRNVRWHEGFWVRDQRLAAIRRRIEAEPDDDVSYLLGQHESFAAENAAMLEALNAVHEHMRQEPPESFDTGEWVRLYATVVNGQHPSARADGMLKRLQRLEVLLAVARRLEAEVRPRAGYGPHLDYVLRLIDGDGRGSP